MPYLKNQNRIYLLLLGICLVFFIPISPPFADLCYDGGVFQYMGMILDNGQLPYTHAFDHKPPVIFILNYLGFVMTPNSTWGIFIIFSMLTFLSSILVYRAAQNRTRNTSIAILISAIFIGLNYNSSILEEYNLTRQFTEFLTIFVFYILFETKMKALNFTFIGSLLGLIFFTQQNEVLGSALITSYYILFAKKLEVNSIKTLLLNSINLIVGLTISFGLIGLIILFWGNYSDFIDQAFLFNFNKYIGDATFSDKVWRSISRFFVIAGRLSGVLLITLIIIIRNLVKGFKNKTNFHFDLKIVGIGLFIQLLATSLSGFAFGHYFLMFIPYLIYILLWSYTAFSDKALKYLKMSIVFVLCFQAINSLRQLSTSKPFYESVNTEVSSVKNQKGQFYPFNPRFLRVNFNWNISSPAIWIYNHSAFLDHFPKGKIYNDIIDDLGKNRTKYILTDSTRGIYPGLQSFLDNYYVEIMDDGEFYKLYKRKADNNH